MAERAFSIGDRPVAVGAPVLVVAEAGVNHDGDVARAEELVDAAADSGADAIKFQMFAAERVASANAPKAGYQRETTGAGESQQEMLARLELAPEEYERLSRRCSQRGILFLASVFDAEAVALLGRLGAPGIKVGSGELTNWPLLEGVAAAELPVILSTGMATLDEVVAAVDILAGGGCERVALLQCTTNYPADPADANLKAIATLRGALGLPVGYSDHTVGMETALAAVALGACIVEKHLTLDTSLPGPDHRASLDPPAFRRFVDGIRIVSAALGDGVKRPAASEAANRDIVRRSIVAARPLPAGEIVEAEALSALRPGTGISPTQRSEIVGRRVRRSLATGEQISWADLE